MERYEVRFEAVQDGDSQGVDTYRFTDRARAERKFAEIKEQIQEDARVMGMEVLADEPDYYAVQMPGDSMVLERVALV
ncbi:MAG: hypothetical protein IJ626_02055 [Muribaculaceae bacterium]|nr:hypothetical protein [Muribaculaceae bacterium]